MKFDELAAKVKQQFNTIQNNRLPVFRVNSDRTTIWETYLNAYPEGTNPIYRTNTEHDCNCCKNFIRDVGNVVAVKPDGTYMTIWDINLSGHYGEVAKAMGDYIRSLSLRAPFLHTEEIVGSEPTRKLYEVEGKPGNLVTFNHFYGEVKPNYLSSDISKNMSDYHSTVQVLERGLETLTLDALNSVKELIAQNTLYRGEQHKSAIDKFIKLKKEYIASKSKYNLVRMRSCTDANVARLRNTSIGQLLIDISEGRELDSAVSAYEAMVAPANYKRPKALVTESMIKRAQDKVQELGIAEALQRRYAVKDDITVNNVLFVHRDFFKQKDVFAAMLDDTAVDPKKFSRVSEMTMDKFIADVLPTATSIEALVENKHANNLMSLIAPEDAKAPSILQWSNNFSWSYKGEVTDSIKERVKKAGGNVTGVLRCSLGWFNYDDLDIHVTEPNGNIIYHGNKFSNFSNGRLDVDMNIGSRGSRQAVENVTWPNTEGMIEGTYKVYINNYAPRETTNVGFDAQIACGNQLFEFHYPKRLSESEKVMVAEFNWSKKDGVTLQKSLPEQNKTQEIWGVTTQTFTPVDMITLSPNHWDDNASGNKHYFFTLKGCANTQDTRGLYNEFLRKDLMEHRKVFEVLGSKLKVKESDNQLSGLGFSSTLSNQLICKVKGSTERTIKITF